MYDKLHQENYLVPIAMKVVELEGVYWNEFFYFVCNCWNKYFSLLQSIESFTLDTLRQAGTSSIKAFILLRSFEQILKFVY
jgi:hypothetical protein